MDGPLKPTTLAMEGGGYYNRHSSMQAAGIASVLPLWQKVASSVPVGDENIVIADYGSSQGHNSMAPMRTAIAALRAASDPARVVQVIHTDLPTNDFASLFEALNNEPDSYMNGEARVFASAVGRSYFTPILAPESVHLGWNSWTLQWLSRNPVEITDHVLAGFSPDEAAQRAVIDQARQDWSDFIAARSFELRPDGKIFCLLAASQEDKETWEWLFGELWAAIVDLKQAGSLTDPELKRMTLPLTGRTLAEIRAPFESGPCCGMTIELAEVVATPDPFWTAFEQDRDATRLGQSWAGIWRAALGPTLASGLNPDRDRGAMLDELFSRFATRISASPREQKNSIGLVILKKSGPPQAA